MSIFGGAGGGSNYGLPPYIVPVFDTPATTAGVSYSPDDQAKYGKPSGHHVSFDQVMDALASLQALSTPPPPAPRAPDWAPMPQPRFRDLLNAPRMGGGQLMPTPGQYAPYMWGR